jgi:hypothetical protein
MDNLIDQGMAAIDIHENGLGHLSSAAKMTKLASDLARALIAAEALDKSLEALMQDETWGLHHEAYQDLRKKRAAFRAAVEGNG